MEKSRHLAHSSAGGNAKEGGGSDSWFGRTCGKESAVGKSWVGRFVAGRVRWLRRRLKISAYRFSYNVLSGFLFAREEAVDVLTEFMEELDESAVGGGGGELFGQALIRVNEDIEAVRGVLDALQRDQFAMHSSLTTMIAARTVLNAQRKAVHTLWHEGMLEKNEAEKISGRVDMAMKRLLRSPPIVALPDTRGLLRRVPWLEPLSDAAIDSLLRHCTEEILPPGEMVIAEGESADYVVLIKRGAVALEIPPKAADAADHDADDAGDADGDGAGETVARVAEGVRLFGRFDAHGLSRATASRRSPPAPPRRPRS